MATITSVDDGGTIVTVGLSDGAIVHFDHSSFRHLVEARQGDLRGECELSETEDGEPILVFENEPD